MSTTPMQTKRPFFVVGSPRSGTTLLQVMLSCLDGVHFSEETKFLHLTVPQRKRFGPLTGEPGVQRTIDRVMRHIDSNQMDVDREELIKQFRAAPPDDYNWFDVLLTHLQDRAGCRRIGEKTPRHMPMVEQILERFPDSRVIAIIRDGRDVATSQDEAFDSDVITSALAWRSYQRMHRRYQHLPADRYTSVRYEDLVTEPEVQMRRLCEFLGEPFTENLLRHEQRGFKGFAERETHKLRTLEPVTSSRVARYRNKMTPGEIAVYQMVAGPELRENGYELEPFGFGRGAFEVLRRLPGFLLRRWRIFCTGVRRGA
jgi:hypothetical protein